MKIEYILIEGRWSSLISDVNEMLKVGYKPQGGVSAYSEADTDGNYTSWYCQAMIKETEE